MSNAAMMAGGMPPQAPQQQQVQVAPGQVSGGDPQKIKAALKAAIQQSVDKNGYVDMNKLVQVWPQISQQMGINIPFQTVLQMVQQYPSLIEDVITEMGLAGIIVNGKMISAEQLLSQAQAGGGGGAKMASGSGMSQSPAPGGQPQGVQQ